MGTPAESPLQDLLKFKDVRLAFLNVFSFPKNKNLKRDAIDRLRKETIIAKDALEFEDAERHLPSRIKEQYFRLKLTSPELSTLSLKTVGAPCKCEKFLTVYQNIGVAILLLNVELNECNVDELIMLEQSADGRKNKNIQCDGKEIVSLHKEVSNYIKRIAKAFGSHSESPPLQQSRCIEICGLADSDLNTKSILDAQPSKPFYGLLTADEGWRFVPAETAQDRMQLRWRTRDYFDVRAFENTVIFTNLTTCPTYESYLTFQDQISDKYGFEKNNPRHTKIAGLYNGPFLALENVALQLSIIEEIGERYHSITQIEKKRKELLATLENLSLLEVEIPEIALLEKKILKATKVPQKTNELKKKLEEVENSLLVNYNRRINQVVIILTGVGTITAVLTILIQVFHQIPWLV